MFKPELVLFDLDGTLVDSVPDLAYSIDSMLTQLGMPTRGEDAVRGWVGNGIQSLVSRALTNSMHDTVDPELFAKAMPLYMATYRANVSKRSRIYDGVVETLDYLHTCPNLHIGCVTNKAEQFTTLLLQDLGLYQRFEIVIAGDTLPEKKPHPMQLLYAAEKFGVKPQNALMVGDSKSDIKAARAAGFKIAAVSYGYNHGEDIHLYEPDVVMDSLLELKKLVTCP